jgi:hypothetical protein
MRVCGVVACIRRQREALSIDLISLDVTLTETQFILRNVMFKIKDRTMGIVQNCNSYINIPSSQTYRSH